MKSFEIVCLALAGVAGAITIGVTIYSLTKKKPAAIRP
jgi:hypothetical protein